MLGQRTTERSEDHVVRAGEAWRPAPGKGDNPMTISDKLPARPLVAFGEAA